jgi:XTP/dITP diphosphohydrolase
MRATAVILATRNPGKLVELRPMFTAAGFSIIDLDSLGIDASADEDELEAHPTFEENALAKAHYFYEVSGGMPCVADDSGLEVDALGGRPGVHSKRWSGRDDVTGQALDVANNASLIAALRTATDRSARYVCAAAFVSVGDAISTRGETAGRITVEPSGPHGFGYDPYFFSAELGRTFGDATVAEKERVSHRGRAMRALLERIRYDGR